MRRNLVISYLKLMKMLTKKQEMEMQSMVRRTEMKTSPRLTQSARRVAQTTRCGLKPGFKTTASILRSRSLQAKEPLQHLVPTTQLRIELDLPPLFKSSSQALRISKRLSIGCPTATPNRSRRTVKRSKETTYQAQMLSTNSSRNRRKRN